MEETPLAGGERDGSKSPGAINFIDANVFEAALLGRPATASTRNRDAQLADLVK